MAGFINFDGVDGENLSKVYSKPLTFTATVSAPVADGTLIIRDSLALGPINLNDGPEESITFVFGKMDGQTFDDLAVDPTNPDVGSSGHPGSLSFGMPDGSVRFLHESDAAGDYAIGAPPADGYLIPSSFQIIAAGPKGEAEPQLTSEPTAPEAYMEIKIKEVLISGVIQNGDAGGSSSAAFEIKDFSFGVENPRELSPDTFDFQPQFTSEPTAPEAGKHEGARDWIKVESWGLADPPGDPVTYTYTVSNPSTAYDDQPAVQDTGLLLPY